jgi:ATP-dependent exoDNAse (exonuclease V) alpha subunit
LRQVRRIADTEQKFAWGRMHQGDFAQALEIFERQGAIHWNGTQNEARDALIAQYAGDSAREPGRQRFVFAFTNADVNALNSDIRALRRERGELGEDHILATKDGPQIFATGDRIQFTGNARTQRARNLGFTNGEAGSVKKIDGARVTVELDGKKHGKPRVVEFTAGDNAEAGQFNAIRHGYAGTIYKGQGKTLDQTYLYHSNHWHGAASYVALTRHREHTKVFVARETAADINQLAKQMARSDERRAASQFHYERGIERSRGENRTAGEQEAARAAERRRARDLFLEPQRPGP